MYSVSCRDLGHAGCDFVAQGKNAHKATDKMLEHVRDEHPELVTGISMEQHEALERRIQSQLVETAA